MTITPSFDASFIYRFPNGAELWQGSVPPTGSVLRRTGFGAVVLCAIEKQIERSLFEGVDVVHAPFNDKPWASPSREDLEQAVFGARQATLRLKDGKNVLVTCRAGLNRSGLVSALTIHMFTGKAGEDCAKIVQDMRKDPGGLGALFNKPFVRALTRIPRRLVTMPPGVQIVDPRRELDF